MIDFAALFEKIGLIGGLINALNLNRGTTIPAHIPPLLVSYADDLELVDDIFESMDSYQSSTDQIMNTLVRIASDTLIKSVKDDTALPNLSISAAMSELIRQMKLDSESVSQTSVSSSYVAGSSNSGNPGFLIGTKTANGLNCDNVFAEVINGTCVTDSVSTTSIAGLEQLNFYGEYSTVRPLDFGFPEGSGSSVSLSLISPESPSNILKNSDMELWTASVPDNWTISVGAAQITKSITVFHDLLASIRFTGDSSTLTGIQQTFGTQNDGVIAAGNQYAFGLFAKVDVVPADGVLEVALVDGSGVILLDNAGNSCSSTFSIPAMTTSFALKSGFLRTPRILPSTTKLRIRLSTALSTGTYLYIDKISFVNTSPIYNQGPTIVGFSSSVPAVIGDTYGITIMNNRAGLMQLLFDKLFGMRSLGYLLPTNASPTISDSLIT